LNRGIEYFEASEFHAKWIARRMPRPHREPLIA
jgi:hypothetical protein